MKLEARNKIGAICEERTYVRLEILPAMPDYAADEEHRGSSEASEGRAESPLPGLLLPPEHALRAQPREGMPHLSSRSPGRVTAAPADVVRLPPRPRRAARQPGASSLIRPAAPG